MDAPAESLAVNQCLERLQRPISLRDIVVGIVTFTERHAGVELHLSTWLSTVDTLILTNRLTTAENSRKGRKPGHIWIVGNSASARRYMQLLPVMAEHFPSKAWYLWTEDDVFLNIQSVRILLSIFDHRAVYWLTREGCSPSTRPIPFRSQYTSGSASCLSQAACLSTPDCRANHACPDGGWHNVGGHGSFFSRGAATALGPVLSRCASAMYVFQHKNLGLDETIGECLYQGGFAGVSVETSVNKTRPVAFLWKDDAQLANIRWEDASASNTRTFILSSATPWARFVYHLSQRELKKEWLPTIGYYANLTDR